MCLMKNTKNNSDYIDLPSVSVVRNLSTEPHHISKTDINEYSVEEDGAKSQIQEVNHIESQFPLKGKDQQGGVAKKDPLRKKKSTLEGRLIDMNSV